MWLPRLWIISSLLILAAAVTGARVTPDLGAERARLAENITLQLRQHALEQSAELSSLAGDPQLLSVMSPERQWASPGQRADRLSELRESLLGLRGAHLTQDLMILDSKLSQLCEGPRCSYEPLLNWSATLGVQESIEALGLKPLHLTERISPPRWAWVGDAHQLAVATSISQKTTLGVLIGLGPTAEQLFKKELERNKLSPDHFALFLGSQQLTSLQVEPPQTNAAQDLMVKAIPSVVTWERYVAQVKAGFIAFKSDPLPLMAVLGFALIWLLLDSRRALVSAPPEEEAFSYDWDLPPSEGLRDHDPAPVERAEAPVNPTSDLPLSTHPEPEEAALDEVPEVTAGTQSPSVPPIIHGEAATPLNAIKTDEFEPADAPELEEEEPDRSEFKLMEKAQETSEEPSELSQADEDAFDELFDELADAPLEGDSFVQELGSFLEGELGELLGAQGQPHLAALDEVAWSQAPAELPAPSPEDPSEYQDFERGISDDLGEVFADELNDPDDFFKHIGLVSAVGPDLFGEVELVHSIAPQQLALGHEDPELDELKEVAPSLSFAELGLIGDSDVSLDEVEVIQSSQPESATPELTDAFSDFEGSLDLENDFPDVLDEPAGDNFHPDLDLTPLPSEEDFRRTPERESQLGELLHGVASIPPADERPTTLAPLTQEALVDDVSAELMGQEEELIYSDEWAIPPIQDHERRPVPTEADLIREAGVHSLDELPVSLDDSEDFKSSEERSVEHEQSLEEGFIPQWEDGEDDEPVHYQELQRAEDMALNPTPYALPSAEKLEELSLSPIEAPYDEGDEGEAWGQESIAPNPIRTDESDLNARQLQALNAFMSFGQEHDELDELEGLDQSPLASESLERDLLNEDPLKPEESFEHDPGSIIESSSMAQVSDLMSLMESEPAPPSASAEEMGFYHEPTPAPEPTPVPASELTPSSEPTPADLTPPSSESLAALSPDPASLAELETVASLAPQPIPAIDTAIDLSPPQVTPEPIDWAAKARARRQARLEHYKEVYQVYCSLKQEHETDARLPALKDFIDQLNQARQTYIDKHGCLDVRFEAKLNKKGRVSIKSREHTPA